MAQLKLDFYCKQGDLGKDLSPGPVVNPSESGGKLNMSQGNTDGAPLQGKFPGGEAAQGLDKISRLANDHSLIKSYAKGK